MSVSVIIPVFNAADHLRACLARLAEWPAGPLERIVVDDGSTDESAEVARSVGAMVRSTGGRNWRQFMSNEEKIQVEGLFVEALPGTQFRVRLDNGHEILAYLAGKMRKYYIRFLLGDRVKVEMSPYDLTRGRITFRHRKADPIPTEE